MTASDTPSTILGQLGNDWSAAPFFTLDQKFAMAPEDGSLVDIYADEDHHIIQATRHVRAFGGADTRRGSKASKLRTSFVLNRASGSYARTIDVADRNISPPVVLPFQMSTSRASEF